MDSAAEGVEGEFSDRDPHAAESLVAQAENPLSVGYDDDVHVVVGPVLEKSLDLLLRRIGHDQPPSRSGKSC